MRDEELRILFDEQAAGYDERWARTAPIRDALHFLLDAAFAGLPPDTRLLSVGAGTGQEIALLAARWPAWQFTIVEPSGAMLALCRERARRDGFEARCRFHEGYLADLPEDEPFDAATSLLVSQFIVDPAARVDFFRGIARRLRPDGLLVSSDLAADVSSRDYEVMLGLWLRMMQGAGVPAAGVEQMRAAYAKDVAILPPGQVAALIRSAGFDEAIGFYQAGLIHAWRSRRAAHL